MVLKYKSTVDRLSLLIVLISTNLYNENTTNTTIENNAKDLYSTSKNSNELLLLKVIANFLCRIGLTPPETRTWKIEIKLVTMANKPKASTLNILAIITSTTNLIPVETELTENILNTILSSEKY